MFKKAILSNKNNKLFIDFNKIIPIKTLSAERLKAWGTNKNAMDTTIEKNTDRLLELTFVTGYKPEKIFKKLSELFTDLNISIKFFEQYWNFAGLILIKKGDIEISNIMPTRYFYKQVYNKEHIA